MLDGAEVLAIADACRQALTAVADRDWSVGVPDLEMTVAGVVAHAAEGCLWYAIDLAAGGIDLDPVEHRVKPDGTPPLLIETMVTYAHVAAAVIDSAPASARGFHPFGSADPSGFAAMAGDELLVHTDDALRGLGEVFTPPTELVAPVLARLFPEVARLFPEVARLVPEIEGAEDPWTLLRWANGRIALPGRPRRERWRWHSSPIEDGGSTPRR